MRYIITVVFVALILVGCSNSEEDERDWSADSRLCQDYQSQPYVQCYTEWGDGRVTAYGDEVGKERDRAEMAALRRWCEYKAVTCTE
jgi:uncharacterized lipoprotein NlpE involved in copper resistance